MRDLLLTSLGGRQYGIWKDAILSVRGMHELHRIPLSPDCIAGVMIDDGESVTLGDLSACIGYGPSRSSDRGHILLVPGGGKASGFVVGGELQTMPIPIESIFPLPEYLKSTIFDTCAIHEGVPIPIINIAGIDPVLFEPGKEIHGKPKQVAGALPQEITAVEHIRFITVAGERHAVPAGNGGGAVKPGEIAPIPGAPPHVSGVTFRDGKLFTVIDLARCIKIPTGAPSASVMLMATIADAPFGFLIDSDEGLASAKNIPIKSLPPIAQSAWTGHVVLSAGEIIPLVDLAMAVSAGSGAAEEKPVWRRYTPDSAFPDIFHVQEVEVVEFSLLGLRYAMPKSEVEDVIACEPCRRLCNAPPIVIGVAEHNGEILPVVDLAMMYGRHSPVAPESRMILVNNGNFRALAITEAVFGERRVPPDMHRIVPVHLPHNLMYGCYPDDKAVRIILNVAAISVHYDQALVRDFVPALSEAMRTSPAGLVSTSPEAMPGARQKPGADEGSKLPRSSATEIPAQTRAEPVPELEEPREMKLKPSRQAEAAAAEFAGREQAAAGEPATFLELKSERSRFSATAGTAIQGSPAAEESYGEAPPAQFHAETASSIPPGSAMPTPDDQRPGALPEDDSEPKPSGGAGVAGEPVVFVEKSPREKPAVAAKKKRARKASAISGDLPSILIASIAGAKSSPPIQPDRETQGMARSSGNQARSAGRTWKIGSAYGVIVALLVGIFYISKTPEIAQIGSSPGTGQAGTAKPLPSPPHAAEVPAPLDLKGPPEQAGGARTGAEREPKTQTSKENRDIPAVNEQAKRTLVLSPLTDEQTELPAASRAPPHISASQSVVGEVYVVQKGDTLWNISAQYTGNPRDYPRIAVENGIANPELIFPGQRLRLAK